MKVRKPIAVAGILVAFVIGFGAAYAWNSVGLASASGLLYIRSENQGSFEQTFDKLAHLGTIEYAAANCSGTSDVQLALRNESKMVGLLAEGNKETNSQLPLAAAQARLAARELIEAEKQSSTSAGSSSFERARSSAITAGWKDSSDAHLRHIIEALDRDTCATGGGASR